MPADEQAKWPSPHGHAIASSETDKMSISNMSADGVLVSTKAIPTTVSDEVSFIMPVANSPNDLLAEAVKVIKKAKLALSNQAQDGKPNQLEAFVDCRDFLAKIGEQNDKR
jgi:hypothetical protein